MITTDKNVQTISNYTKTCKEMYLKYEEITVNMARQSEVSVLEHVIKDPADMTTQVSFIGIGESLHYDRHVAGRLVVHQQQTLAVNALRYVVTRLHD